MAWPTRSREVNQFSFSLFAVVLLFVSVGPHKSTGPIRSQIFVGSYLTNRHRCVTWRLRRRKNIQVIEGRAEYAEREACCRDTGFLGDAAVQRSAEKATAVAAIPSPLANFEGLSNQDNFNIYGGRVNPPDPDGDVGPNHYVEMINLVFAVYSKNGALLLGPVPVGALWAGFSVPDCTDPSGDSIVLYDQFVDRWILTHFTTSGLDDPTNHSGIALRSQRQAIRLGLTIVMHLKPSTSSSQTTRSMASGLTPMSSPHASLDHRRI